MSLTVSNFAAGTYQVRYADGTTSLTTVKLSQRQTLLDMYNNRATLKNGSGSKAISIRWVSA